MLSDEGDKMAKKGTLGLKDRGFSTADGGKDDAIEEVECRRKGGKGSDGPRRPVGREKMARHVEIGHPLGVLMGMYKEVEHRVRFHDTLEAESKRKRLRIMNGGLTWGRRSYHGHVT